MLTVWRGYVEPYHHKFTRPGNSVSKVRNIVIFTPMVLFKAAAGIHPIDENHYSCHSRPPLDKKLSGPYIIYAAPPSRKPRRVDGRPSASCSLFLGQGALVSLRTPEAVTSGVLFSVLMLSHVLRRCYLGLVFQAKRASDGV